MHNSLVILFEFHFIFDYVCFDSPTQNTFHLHPHVIKQITRQDIQIGGLAQMVERSLSM